MQLNELRKDLRFNGELMSLVETLKNVAGSQYHLLEKQKARFEAFMDAFAGFFRVVDLVAVRNPLVQVESLDVGVLIVTSDSGFMGGLNNSIIRAGLEAVGAVPRARRRLIVIGDKGAGAIADQGYEFKHFPGVSQETIYEQAMEVTEYVMAEVLARRIGVLKLAYAKAVSFTMQTVATINLLPCAELFDRDADSEIAAHLGYRRFLADARRVIVESAYDDMVEYLASQWVTAKLYEVFEDSKLAEFSARATHLEGSLQKVEKEYAKIKHKCSKAAHELVDKGMRESFAAKSTKLKKRKRQSKAA